MADEFGAKDLKPAYDKMRTMLVKDVVAEAQAIYDRYGEPPYENHPSFELPQVAAVIGDFIAHWLPYLKRKGNT